MEDLELVARIRSGDLAAASDLLYRYQDVVYSVTLRLLGNPSDAEDVAQEVLVRAYTRLADLQEGASFSSWLRRIAINLSLNALRRRGQLRFESLDAAKGDDIMPRTMAEAFHPTPEEAALAGDLKDKVDDLLQKLPADQRVAVVLRDMYDYDVAEIATLQQCGISAAKMRIKRGRTMLRRLLIDADIPIDGSGD